MSNEHDSSFWPDPVEGARQIAGSKGRVIFFACAQLLFMGLGIWTIYHYTGWLAENDFRVWKLTGAEPSRHARELIVLGGAIPMVMAGVGWPIYYLWAMYWLLKANETKKT